MASAAKKLSTSTLSLKFMQNAHRAKNLAEVQLDKAEVRDDGEWEVAQEVRDAWGVGSETSQSVSYEASYLPFLFAPENSTPNVDTTTKLKGRRAFKRGREVADEYQAIPSTAPTPPTASTSKSSNPKTTGTGKLKSISSASLSGRSNPNKRDSNTAKGKGKTAREAVRDNAGVGADLRSTQVDAPTPSAATLAPAPNVFLKPAGVDDAPDASTRKPRTNGKRAREEEGGDEGGNDTKEGSNATKGSEGTKKRKKKRKSEAANGAE